MRVALAMSTALMVTAMCVGAQTADDDNRVRELGTTITGNQDQPKVLYIVPWKSADSAMAIPYRPVTGQTDVLFDHVERSEHRRQLEFLQDLNSAD